MSWATTADVAALTGVTVTDALLAQAQGVIDIHAGRTWADDLTRVGDRDRSWLALAVAYQAAWMAAQIDLFSRTEVTAVNQDGMQYSPGHEDAMVLAPLARRSLRRLSWRRSRSVRVRPRRPTEPAPVSDLVDADDYGDGDAAGWTPL
ncbi:hypothetical protein [Parafrankia discariae]|uniref:hypothetical protein n=1 Tax=Parafrankia discariae TaxID=365528 RepID=UPI00035DA77E|nr:hypothetical protein [Parafrankia discariae]